MKFGPEASVHPLGDLARAPRPLPRGGRLERSAVVQRGRGHDPRGDAAGARSRRRRTTASAPSTSLPSSKNEKKHPKWSASRGAHRRSFVCHHGSDGLPVSAIATAASATVGRSIKSTCGKAPSASGYALLLLVFRELLRERRVLGGRWPSLRDGHEPLARERGFHRIVIRERALRDLLCYREEHAQVVDVSEREELLRDARHEVARPLVVLPFLGPAADEIDEHRHPPASYEVRHERGALVRRRLLPKVGAPKLLQVSLAPNLERRPAHDESPKHASEKAGRAR